MINNFINFWRELIDLGNSKNAYLIPYYLEILHKYTGSEISAFAKKMDSITIKTLYSYPEDFPAEWDDIHLDLFSSENFYEIINFADSNLPKDSEIIFLPVSSNEVYGAFILVFKKSSINPDLFTFLENAKIALTQRFKVNNLLEVVGKQKYQFNIILETIPEAIIYFEEDGNFVWLNTPARKMIKVDETVSNPAAISSAMHKFREKAINRDEILSVGLRLFQNHNEQISNWHWLFGDPVNCVYRVSVLNTQFQESKGQLWVFDDVTNHYLSNLELKRLNKELEEKKAQAEKANNSKSIFLANMSHELRTPLNAILGFSQILKFSGELSKTDKEHVSFIHKSGEHLLSLINDILDLSKIEAGKLNFFINNFSLKALIYTISKMIEVKALEKGLGFELEISPDLPDFIQFDEQKLKQVILNLLSNAVKYTDKGEVVLSIQNEILSEKKQKIKFSIKDTGRGIPQADVDQIFVPFERLNSTSGHIQGTGLGLSITKSLVELMNSKIFVESESGKGSTFAFSIEVELAEGVKQETKAPDEVIGYEGNRIKILIVDDNLLNRLLLEKSLLKWNFTLEHAENGMKALEKIEDFNPDLVLMDLRMPGISGYDSILKIRENPKYNHIKIIATSASAFNETRDKCLAVGADDFMSKPIDIKELINKLTTTIKVRWILKNQNDEKEKNESKTFHISPQNIPLLKDLREGAKNGEIAKMESILSQLISNFPEDLDTWKKFEKYIDHFEINLLVENLNHLLETTDGP